MSARSTRSTEGGGTRALARLVVRTAAVALGVGAIGCAPLRTRMVQPRFGTQEEAGSGHLAVLSLESYASPLEERPPEAEAIVVFSAEAYPPEGPRTHAELGEDSLHRCLQAARLYKQGPPCPVFVSGGKVDPDMPGPPNAALMAAFLSRVGVKESDLPGSSQVAARTVPVVLAFYADLETRFARSRSVVPSGQLRSPPGGGPTVRGWPMSSPSATASC